MRPLSDHNGQMANDVVDNAELSRYELEIEGDFVVVAYRLEGGILDLTHAGTPPALRGRGLAGIVTRFALEDARARGLRVKPTCPYVAWFIDQNPEFADLAV